MVSINNRDACKPIVVHAIEPYAFASQLVLSDLNSNRRRQKSAIPARVPMINKRRVRAKSSAFAARSSARAIPFDARTAPSDRVGTSSDGSGVPSGGQALKFLRR